MMLNEEGYRTYQGRLFGLKLILRVLRNRAYIGIRRWEDTLERGLLSLEEAAHRIKDLRAERDALVKKKIVLEKKSPAGVTVRVIPTALMNTYIRELLERLRETKLGAKKEFLREIVNEVRVRGKTVRMTYKLPLAPRTSPSQEKISRGRRVLDTVQFGGGSGTV